jgi:hypothetical protein
MENGRRITEIINLFYKRMLQSNTLKLVLINPFSKQAFSFFSFIKVISINLIKLYYKATTTASQLVYNYIDFVYLFQNDFISTRHSKVQ